MLVRGFRICQSRSALQLNSDIISMLSPSNSCYKAVAGLDPPDTDSVSSIASCASSASLLAVLAVLAKQASAQ